MKKLGNKSLKLEKECSRKAQEEAARQQALKAQADAGKAELEARAAKVDLEVMRMRHKEWVEYHVPWYGPQMASERFLRWQEERSKH